jgi:hypothetical protein
MDRLALGYIPGYYPQTPRATPAPQPTLPQVPGVVAP